MASKITGEMEAMKRKFNNLLLESIMGLSGHGRDGMAGMEWLGWTRTVPVARITSSLVV